MQPLAGVIHLVDTRGIEIYLNLAHLVCVEFSTGGVRPSTGPLTLDRTPTMQAVVTTIASSEPLTFRGRDAYLLRRELRRHVGLPEEG
jgi:hypothetical protein